MESNSGIRKLTKKMEKLSMEFDKMRKHNEELIKEKENAVKERLEAKTQLENTEKELAQVRKKLYKIEADEDIINLDPYEMHRKIRYYEAQLEFNDKEFNRWRKELKEIKDYMEYLGLTKEDLRVSWVTGVFQLSNFNSKAFELNYKKPKSPDEKKGSGKHMKSSSSNKKKNSEKKHWPLEKYDEIRRVLNSSNARNCNKTTNEDTIEVDSLSLSSDTCKSSKGEFEPLSLNTKLNIPPVNDFARSKPSTNLEILKYLSKMKEDTEESPVDSNGLNSSQDSFYMKSRKRSYEDKINAEKLQSQGFLANLS